MVGWIKKNMDGWMDKKNIKKWMVGWIKKQMDGWMDRKKKKKDGWLDG